LFIILGASLLGMRESGKVQSFSRRYLLLPLAAGMLGGIASPIRPRRHWPARSSVY
jgi:hypothetical protein